MRCYVDFEIAPDTSAIDAITVDNVKSSDKEVIEAVEKEEESIINEASADVEIILDIDKKESNNDDESKDK